jgi:wyosine [tRNA(Phe)-imidazoG37] synthetase (radical SAM superfamily)
MESIDVVTFSGGGEPTLNPDMGEILDRVRRLTSGKVPIVLLTNSSLLHRDDVRRTVAGFDTVVAKLDAGEESAYRTINRPIASAPSIETIIKSIKKLKKEIKGTLMTQTMFFYTDFDFTNCDGKALNSLLKAIVVIKPDVIQIDTPYRPGGERFVNPASVDKLKSIGKRFEEYIENVNAPSELWVFGAHDKRGRKAAWKEHSSIREAIVGLLKRRPCRVVDIADSLGISYKEALGNIYDLLEDCRIVKQIASNEEEYYRPR